MSKLLLFFTAVLLSISVWSQDSLYVDDDGYLLDDNVNISGYGGPLLSFSQINDHFAFFMGGGGAILFNDRFFIGGYGTGMTNKISIDSSVYKGSYIGFANGGLWAGYVFMGGKKVHPILSLMVGWGNVSVANELGYIKDMDNIYAITPCLDIELNLTDYLKISTGIHYRNVTGINEMEFEEKDFSSMGGHITLKFGWFGDPLEQLE